MLFFILPNIYSITGGLKLPRGSAAETESVFKDATKYLDHYLSWFQFLDTIKHIKDHFTITKMVLNSCSFSVNITYGKGYRDFPNNRKFIVPLKGRLIQ
jgi:hypothetical protein